MRLTQCLTFGVLWLALSGTVVFAHTPAARGNRVENVAKLLKELRWHDDEGREQYESDKAENTRLLLNEIDHFIAESFAPGVATADQVRGGLDGLLGSQGRDVVHNAAFAIRLSGSETLLVGVDIWRGSDAINENAMSFRGYRNVSQRYSLVAVADLDGSYDLHVQAFGSSPVGSEFHFLAWAGVSPTAPPTVTITMLGFDGDAIRTVWGPEQFVTRTVYDAVHMTPDGGFSLSTLADRRDVSTIVKHYFVTADGPQKVAESDK
jgi:hypothetical protein